MIQRFTSLRPRTDLPEIEAVLRKPAAEPAAGRTWFSINNLSRDEAEVLIYDFIGDYAITPSDFMRELNGIKAKTITLRINSNGGDVSDGIAIFNAIRRHTATVNVIVDGMAASIASVIAMAGDTVTMAPYSEMLIHDAWGMAVGPADEMRKAAAMFDKASDNIAGVYAERAGGTVAEWRALMISETTFSDQEAVVAGLADGIDGVEIENKAVPVKNELPEAEPEEETEEQSSLEPPDFAKLFEDIADAVEDDIYQVA